MNLGSSVRHKACTFLFFSHCRDGIKSSMVRTAPGWTMVGWFGGGGACGVRGDDTWGGGPLDGRGDNLVECGFNGEEGGVGRGGKESWT